MCSVSFILFHASSPKIAGLPFKEFQFHGRQAAGRILRTRPDWRYEFQRAQALPADPIPPFLQAVCEKIHAATGFIFRNLEEGPGHAKCALRTDRLAQGQARFRRCNGLVSVPAAFACVKDSAMASGSEQASYWSHAQSGGNGSTKCRRSSSCATRYVQESSSGRIDRRTRPPS